MADNFFSTANAPSSDDGLDNARLLNDIVSALSTAGHLATFDSATGGEVGQERAVATLHFYACANGVFGARQAAALCETDVGFRLLSGGRRFTHQQLLEYRDGANARLALLFTELVVALTDCGLDTFGHTPLHAVIQANGREARARAAAELAVALLNAAKRRDDIENTRYGFDRRGDELPGELLQPEERNHRIQAMLRLRGGDAAGTWDEPTKLIDLNSLEDGFDLDAPAPPKSLRQQLTTAANEAARDGLLPREKSANVPAVTDSAEWNPHIDFSKGGGTIPDEDIARIQAASDGRIPSPRLEPSLAKPTVMPRTAPARRAAPVQMQSQPIAPASPQGPPSSQTAPATAFSPEAVAAAQATTHRAASASISSEAQALEEQSAASQVGAASQRAPNRAAGLPSASSSGQVRKKAASAVMGMWLMSHWQKVIILLVVLVFVALFLTLRKF